jgi:hypothetical protein
MRNRYQFSSVPVLVGIFAFLDLKGAQASVTLVDMKSALRLFVGVALLASGVGCDGGAEDEPGGPKAVAGNGTSGSGVIPNAGNTSTGGGGAAPTAGSGTGGGTLAEGVPLTPMEGWVDGATNTLMIQGAMFEFADATSAMGMTKDFTGSNACIKGTAAKVDKMSTACTTMMFTAPATDCYGEYWGAAIGLNLNQPIDMTTMMGGDPVAYDASAIKGFTFNISGAMVPTTMRFKVEEMGGEYCTPATKPVKLGANTFMFEDLVKECWKTTPGASAVGAKAALVKIAWQVTTKDTMAIPFDFCVSDLRAIQ